MSFQNRGDVMKTQASLFATILFFMILALSDPSTAIQLMNNKAVGDTAVLMYPDLMRTPAIKQLRVSAKLQYQPTGKLITETPVEIKSLADEPLDLETRASLQLFFEREELQRQPRIPASVNFSLRTLLGTNLRISTDSTLAPAPNTQEKPAIASNGDIYLAVWHDWRNQYCGTFTDGDIYATRVDASGNILDPEGILVCNAQNNQLLPAVASDGQDFLVVWLDARNPIPNFDEWDIYGARISAQGTVLDNNGFLIEDKPNVLASAAYPPLRIARSDSNYMIVWEQKGAFDSAILGHILNQEGRPMFSDPIAMPKNAGGGRSIQYQYPAVASNGDLYLVGWCEFKLNHAMLRAARVALSGAILDSAGITVFDRSNQYNIAPKHTAVAFVGDTALVAFNNSSNFAVEGMRLFKDGTRIDNSPFLIIAAGPTAEPISITSDANNWLVSVAKRVGYDYLVATAVVTKAGAVIGPHHLFPSSAGISTRNWASPVVSSNSKGFFIAWDAEASSQNGIEPDIIGARLSPNGAPVESDYITLALAPSEQLFPAVAFDGTNYLAVWQDSRNAGTNERGYDIYGARITQEGVVIDSEGIPICTPPRHQMEPKVAFDGINYFVVWEDRRELPSMGYAPLKRIYGTFVSKDGKVLNPNGIPIIPSDLRQDLYQVNPDVAFGKDSYLVVWQNGDTWLPHGVGDIFAVRVSTNGSLIDQISIGITAPGQFTGLTQDAEFPEVAFNGKEFLITWSDYRNATVMPVSDAKDIYAARVSTEGQLIDPLRGFQVSREKKLCTFPQAATDGTNWLITWEQSSYAGYNFSPFDVFGTLLSQSGVPRTNADIPISNLASNEELPSVAFNGQIYTVTWTDDRNNSWDIYAARIDTQGTLADKNGFLVSDAPGIQILPAIAAGDTNMFIAWIDDRSFTQTGSDIYGTAITIQPPQPLRVSTTELPAAKVNEEYQVTLSASGGVPPYTWGIIAGQLPKGYSFNNSSGKISGVTVAHGRFEIDVIVGDSQLPAKTDTAHLILQVIPLSVEIITTELEFGRVQIQYSDTLSVQGGVKPYTWEIIFGKLPDGLSLNKSLGIVAGTPTLWGDFNFTVRVFDSQIPPVADTNHFTIKIKPEELRIVTNRLGSGKVGKIYADTLRAAGGVLPYHWRIVNGSLPPSLELEEDIGTILGTPTLYGDYSFTIKVTDSYAPPDSSLYRLRIIIHPTQVVNKMVLAHYLGWYADSTYKFHPRRHWKSGYAHKPQIGEYDSRDPALIIYHTLLAWACGINGFIHDWYGKSRYEGNTYDDSAYEDSSFAKAFFLTKQLNQAYPELNFKLSICYDQNLELKLHKDVRTQVQHIWDKYVSQEIGTSDTTYLWAWNERIQRESPVLFYFTKAATDFKKFQQDIDSVLPDSLSWLLVVKELPLGLMKYVDSAYPWVQVDSSDTSNWRGSGNYIDWFYRTAVARDTIQFITGGTWPGFDDRYIVDPTWPKHGYMSRLNGQTYDSTWYFINKFDSLYQKENYLRPSWVQIETWNDWNEGTEIEPSIEYGPQYLFSTIDHINEFKGTSIEKEEGLLACAKRIYSVCQTIDIANRDSLLYHPDIRPAIAEYFRRDWRNCTTNVHAVDNSQSIVPTKHLLYQNYPNPFNPSTVIRFDLPKEGRVQLRIFDIKGQLVNTLVDRRLSAGSHTVTWDARDNQGRTCPTSIYFCRLEAGGYIAVRKLILLK
jgi:hypothetical protein